MQSIKIIVPDNYATSGCAITGSGVNHYGRKAEPENLQSTLPQMEALEQQLKEIRDGK
jgi:hypothetical protein